MKPTRLAAWIIIFASLALAACHKTPKEVERPEKIVSLTKVWYDSTTYAKLAGLWEKYYEAYPSEDAYANWMYAARYSDAPDLESLLDKGVEKYPANPTLLYLSGMSKDKSHDSQEGRELLLKSAALDQTFMDPWYGLAVNAIVRGDRENADVALRRILNGMDIEDVVMDFSYNMLATLDTGAILITNGDNDTFPGWILTRIVRFRPDVNIVNRSLLNVDSYVSSIVGEGVPEFISRAGLDSLKVQVAAEKARPRVTPQPRTLGPQALPFGMDDFMVLGDRLIFRMIEAAKRAGRPVYFACTMNSPGLWLHIDPAQVRPFGLAMKVTPSTTPYQQQLRKLFTTWISHYRTGGLDSWRLHAAREMSAGRLLASNYAAALHGLIHQIGEEYPDTQLSLFRWYRDHIVGILLKNNVDSFNSMWFDRKFPQEIRNWSMSKGWLGD